MDESRYRESRVCRLLGSPVVYQLVLFLENDGPLTPSKLAKIAGRSVQTVSGHLAKLRAADLVRYDTDGNERKDFGRQHVLPEPRHSQPVHWRRISLSSISRKESDADQYRALVWLGTKLRASSLEHARHVTGGRIEPSFHGDAHRRRAARKPPGSEPARHAGRA